MNKENNFKNKVLINSVLYTFGSLLTKAIGFILLPIYTLFLSPTDYGITNLTNSFIQVASFIVTFSLYSSIIRLYTEYKKDDHKLKRFYGTVIIFTCISGLVFIIMSCIFKDVIVSIFFKNINFYPIVFITLLNLLLLCLHSIHTNIMQAMQQGAKLTRINLVVFFSQAILNILFIVVIKIGVLGMLIATFFVNIVYSIYMINDLNRNNMVKWCIDFKILKESLKYSIPLIPHNISTNIANLASRIFMNNVSNLSVVGLYSVASQFGTIIDLIQTSVNKAFIPWFYDILANKIQDKNTLDIVTFSKILLLFYSIIYMVIGLFSQEAIILMTSDDYTISWTIVPILVVAFSVKSIYYFYVNILFYYKETAKKVFIATLLGSFSDIIIAYIMVPKYGMYGSAIAFLLAKIIVTSIVVKMSTKYNNIGYKIVDMIKIILPSLVFMLIGLLFSYNKYMMVFSWKNILYKLFILSNYLLFACLTNLQMIKQLIESLDLNNVIKKYSASKVTR